MQIPVIVVAKQRSGTNLLRRTLGTSTLFEDMNEVFHHREPAHFWNFRSALVQEDPSLLLPTEENQAKVLSLFFESLKETLVSKKFFLIDIKYNSVHHLNPIWHNPIDIPHIFSILAEQEVPVIHLVRTNILETYVSSLVANNLKVWVTQRENLVKDLRLKVNTKQLLAQLRRRQREIETFRTWFSELNSLHTIELNYESLLNEKSSFSQSVLDEIREFLAVNESLEVSTPTKKIASSLPEMIENYDEIVSTLAQTEFSPFLEMS